MEKKEIYLVQAGCLYGDTYYLPYAAGMLAAYAFDDNRIKECYDLRRIIFRLDDIDEILDSMDSPFFVGFSNSIWNYEYNLEFARKLKEKFPDCLVQFGGHQVPPTTEFLEKYPFIDFLAHRKGEESFKSLLLAHIGIGELKNIPNISYRENGKYVQTEYINSTNSDYPSPYLTGVFDDIISDTTYHYSCVLESNRGCPYNCSYCDWGELNSKVRLFPLEKVLDELQWMSDHKMEFVYLIDANFGMFERDEIIAKKLVELKETTGYPNRLQVSYAKDEPDRTYRINRMLFEHGIGKGATLSLQSLSPEVLENIGRKNISPELYSSQIARYREAGISTYTELIMGLPGETKESFCRGLCHTLELGQHSSVSTYYCELLPNSRMGSKEYMEKYGIKTVTSVLNQFHCKKMDDVLSGESIIVVGTNTMSTEDWIETNIFSVFLQSFHHFGLLQCYAMYINKEKGISYYEFYSELLDFVRNESAFLKEIHDETLDTLRGFVNGKNSLTVTDDRFGDITYPLEELVFLKCLYDSDVFYEEVSKFICRFIDNKEIFSEITEYQRSVVLRPGKTDFSKNFGYDFPSYYGEILKNNHIQLEKKKILCILSTPFVTDNYIDYAREIIWYGRRNNRMMYYSKPNTMETEEQDFE